MIILVKFNLQNNIMYLSLKLNLRIERLRKVKTFLDSTGYK